MEKVEVLREHYSVMRRKSVPLHLFCSYNTVLLYIVHSWSDYLTLPHPPSPCPTTARNASPYACICAPSGGLSAEGFISAKIEK